MKSISLSFAALALFLPSSALCGNGDYRDDSPDRIKLYVLFEYYEDDVDSWKPLFQNASRLLFDATEKQVKISTVVFNNDRCRSARGRSDVRIFNDQNRAFAVGLLDAIGYIGLSQVHEVNSTDFRGQVGLVHEIGHYVFGLRDEYKNKNGGTPAPGCFAEGTAGFATASLMTAGSEQLNTRTEFCVHSNHNKGQTQQDRRRRLFAQSNTFLEDSASWEWIVAFAGERYQATLTPPLTPPGSDISEFGQEVQFEEANCTVRLSLGTNSRNRPEAAVRSLEKFVVLLEESDAAGLVSASQDIPIRRMTTDRKFQSLSEFKEGGAPLTSTRLFQESLRQLELHQSQEKGAIELPNEAILLISDGAGGDQGVLKDLLAPIDRRGVAVFNIGVGNNSGTDGFPQVAEETGGSFLSADSTADIDAAAMVVLAKVKGRGIIEASEGRVGADTKLVDPIEVPIDRTTTVEAADFILTWSGPGDELGMKLLAPDGTEVGAGALNAIFQTDRNRQVKRYRILQPASGPWKVVISNPSSAPRDYAFQAHSLAPDVMVKSRASEQIVAFPEPILLNTLVTIGQPVAGAQVTARIERPNGTVVTIDLWDNGDDDDRDAEAEDGIYSGVFNAYQGSGTYDIEITVNSAGGSTTAPGEPGGTFIPQLVPSFVRKDRYSVVVTGAPN